MIDIDNAVVVLIVNSERSQPNMESEYERIVNANPSFRSCTVDGKPISFYDAGVPSIVVIAKYGSVSLCEELLRSTEKEDEFDKWWDRFKVEVEHVLDNTVGFNDGQEVAIIPHWGITLSGNSPGKDPCHKKIRKYLSKNFCVKLISHSYNWGNLFDSDNTIKLDKIKEFLEDAVWGEGQ